MTRCDSCECAEDCDLLPVRHARREPTRDRVLRAVITGLFVGTISAAIIAVAANLILG